MVEPIFPLNKLFLIQTLPKYIFYKWSMANFTPFIERRIGAYKPSHHLRSNEVKHFIIVQTLSDFGQELNPHPVGHHPVRSVIHAHMWNK
jgi:hypothetical protein